MRSNTKAWVAGEQKRGMRAAAVPALLGTLQILAAIAQVACAAHLLAAVLLPHLRHAGPVIADSAGYAIFALLRAGFAHRAALAGFEAGAASCSACSPAAPAALPATGIRRNWHRWPSTGSRRWRVSTAAGSPPPFWRSSDPS
jgi:hypothetical protein